MGKPVLFRTEGSGSAEAAHKLRPSPALLAGAGGAGKGRSQRRCPTFPRVFLPSTDRGELSRVLAFAYVRLALKCAPSPGPSEEADEQAKGYPLQNQMIC